MISYQTQSQAVHDVKVLLKLLRRNNGVHIIHDTRICMLI